MQPTIKNVYMPTQLQNTPQQVLGIPHSPSSFWLDTLIKITSPILKCTMI